MANKDLQDSLDATHAIDTIKLSLNSSVGKDIVHVLVEGVDDCKIYPKCFDADKTRIKPVTGKEQVVLALKELIQITRQVIGICDADFAHLEGKSPPLATLFFTDCHDIEMTMLSNDDVLQNVFTEYALQNKATDIMQNALNEASFIAYIRWYNEKNDCEIEFPPKLGGFITVISDKVCLNKGTLLDALNKRSTHKVKAITTENIEQFREDNQTADYFNLCQGHDVTALLALLVSKLISARKKISHEIFCSGLRHSFQLPHFAQTKLHADILAWQTANGFCVLK